MSEQDFRSVLREVRTYYLDCMDLEYPEYNTRPEQLRVSGFPYCGWRHANKKLHPDAERKMLDFGAHFYTGVGTVTHAEIQKWIGQAGKMWGNWKCQFCKTERKFSNRDRCPKCGATMEYIELDVKFMKHVSGHLDGVFKTKDGRWILIDYKTCSMRKIKQQRTEKTLPYLGNVQQIKAYCALIEHSLGIKISGWVLLYVARDDPKYTVYPAGEAISDEEKASVLRRIRRYDRHFDLVMNRLDEKALRVLAEERPCRSREYYEANYHSDFKPCPLGVCGTCFSEKKIERRIRENVEILTEGIPEREEQRVRLLRPKKQKLLGRIL